MQTNTFKQDRLNKCLLKTSAKKNSLINERPISELVGRGVVQKVVEDRTVRVHRQKLLKSSFKKRRVYQRDRYNGLH